MSRPKFSYAETGYFLLVAYAGCDSLHADVHAARVAEESRGWVLLWARVKTDSGCMVFERKGA